MQNEVISLLAKKDFFIDKFLLVEEYFSNN